MRDVFAKQEIATFISEVIAIVLNHIVCGKGEPVLNLL